MAPEIEHSTPGQLESKRLPHLKHLIRIDDEKTPGYYNFKELYDMYDSYHLLGNKTIYIIFFFIIN